MTDEVETTEVVESDVQTDATEDNQEIDYKAKFEEAEKEKNRLNSLIQKHKKDKPNKKVDESKQTEFGKEQIKAMLDERDSERDFYISNPDMVEHKEAINKFTSTGLSHKQAMALVIADDSTIAARANTNNSNITGGMSGGGQKTYSQEDLYKLGQKNPALKRQAMELIAAGKAIETN